MSATYLIKSDDLIKIRVIIPEADVLQLHITPYNLIGPVDFNQFVILKNAYLTASNNQTQGYLLYQNIILEDDSPNTLGVYEEQGPIEFIYLIYFNIGVTFSPILSGAFNKRSYGVNIKFTNAPAAGDGDLIVYLEYNILTV